MHGFCSLLELHLVITGAIFAKHLQFNEGSLILLGHKIKKTKQLKMQTTTWTTEPKKNTMKYMKQRLR